MKLRIFAIFALVSHFAFVSGPISIVLNGDSLSTNTTESLEKELERMNPNRDVISVGWDGSSIAQIFARFGSNPAKITVSGDATLSPNTWKVCTLDIPFLNSTSNSATATIMCLVNGQLCIIRRTKSGGVETYEIMGATQTVAANTPIYPLDFGGRNTHNLIQVFWVGTNNKYESDTASSAHLNKTIQYVNRAVSLLPYPKRYIVMGALLSTDERIGGTSPNVTVRTRVLAANAQLAAAFSANYVDCNAVPTTEEMAAIGFTPDATDLADIAAGVIPTGMRRTGDQLHLDIDGCRLEALRITRKNRSLSQ